MAQVPHQLSRIQLAGSPPQEFMQATRSAIRGNHVDAVIIDLTGIEYIDPAELRVLRLLADEARSAGVRLMLDGVRAEVYKALQIAQLAPLFTRVHHGRQETSPRSAP